MKPLLTIAIPTYNRASILDKSLSTLLPQINSHSAVIELIISDNASIDNTQKNIQKHVKKHPNINFLLNIQPYNTGYYGNFKTCRELSNGKYLWLLSDNEHILEGVIEYLIADIKHNNDVGAYYFYNTKKKVNFSIIDSDLKSLNEDEHAYKLTLISSVVFLNDKTYDSYVFNKYIENSFLGFLLLCNALRINKNIKIVKGAVFFSAPCNVSFNIFESWTKHILETINYIKDCEILNSFQIKLFINSILKNVLLLHVLEYLLKGDLHGKRYGSKQDLKLLLNSYYLNNDFYRRNILPLFRKNKTNLKLYNFLRRLKNKLQKILIKPLTIFKYIK